MTAVYFLASLTGSVAGALLDPGAWVMCVVVLLLAVKHAPWWSIVPAIVAFDAIHMFLMASTWERAGLSWTQFVWWQLLVKAIIALIVFAVARGMRAFAGTKT